MTLKDETATHALAARVAYYLAPGDVLALSGDLGAGKTTLARGILHALGVKERVPSPTFTLVQSYETSGLTVHHFDLYRVDKPSDLTELGFDDALEKGAVLVEWPERGLPQEAARDALFVSLTVRDRGLREARISGPQRWRSAFAGQL